MRWIERHIWETEDGEFRIVRITGSEGVIYDVEFRDDEEPEAWWICDEFTSLRKAKQCVRELARNAEAAIELEVAAARARAATDSLLN